MVEWIIWNIRSYPKQWCIFIMHAWFIAALLFQGCSNLSMLQNDHWYKLCNFSYNLWDNYYIHKNKKTIKFHRYCHHCDIWQTLSFVECKVKTSTESYWTIQQTLSRTSVSRRWAFKWNLRHGNSKTCLKITS